MLWCNVLRVTAVPNVEQGFVFLMGIFSLSVVEPQRNHPRLLGDLNVLGRKPAVPNSKLVVEASLCKS